MKAMREQGMALRPIAAAITDRGFKISHETVKHVVSTQSGIVAVPSA